MRKWLAFTMTLAGLAVIAGTPAAALGPVPLPAFEVASLEDQRVASSDLGGSGKWLLIYVRPKSVPSELLLRLVRKEEDAASAGHIVVVVGGSLPEARQVCEAFPGVARAAWYADPDRAAFAALNIKGAPTAVGLRDRNVMWRLDGVPAESRTVKSILLTWLAE